MARLTDNHGKLLGGMEISLAQLLAPLNLPSAVPAPAPDYAPKEVVFALECNYGSLDVPAYPPSSGVIPAEKRRKAPPRCHASIEEPEERHFCPVCWGFYCLAHAAPFNHDCRSA